MMRRLEKHETTLVGEEPLWEGCEKLSDMELSSKLGRALNWYNYLCAPAEYREFVISYCKQQETISKEILASIRSIDADAPLFRDMGGSCRVLSLGGIIKGRDHTVFSQHMNQLLALAKDTQIKEEVAPKTKKPSVQENLQNKICSTISDIEMKLDEFVQAPDYKQFLKSFNIDTWITGNKLKTYECLAIHDFYSEIIKEKIEALEGKDPQLNEAYEYLGKIKLRKMIDLLTEIISVSGQYAMKKCERKPRKKKKKSAEVLIKKLKFLKEFTDLGLTSVDPRSIIGASKLVVYNTKLDKICLYESSSVDGFSVKGTSLLNVSKGVTKTVRKPKDFIKYFNSGIRGITNQYDALKTKETESSPRINEHTIIVKAFK
jgi:hypothetical protein